MFQRLMVSLLALASLAAGSEKHTLLAVFAHPDDETVIGPLLAKYAREGHRVHLVTLTAGQLGTSEHAKIPAGEALAKVRAKELACAVEKLGLTGHTLLEFQDQGFVSGWESKPMNDAADKVREAINSLRPDVIITWGPDGGTGHPDHRTTSNVVTQAFQQRSLLKHAPAKLYYVAFPDVPVAPIDWAVNRKTSDEFVTTEIDCSHYLKQAQMAVRCHNSQWLPDLMEEIRQTAEAQRGRAALRLALSRVGMPGRRETDVFERLK